MTFLGDVTNWALGLDARQLNIWQMGLRAAIIYLAALIMVRIAGDRPTAYFINKPIQ